MPLGLGGGKLLSIGGQPVNVRLVLYYNVERPTNAADWQLRFGIRFLFPR